METYTILREIADSWVLLAMVAFFIIAVLFLFRPGAKTLQDDASMIPFRDEKPTKNRKGKNLPGSTSDPLKETSS
ncbi:MAG: cbb3-type cytochrome c oxidase subunit 3 [Rhodobacterales bacterium]